jgi:hypothetical protein
LDVEIGMKRRGVALSLAAAASAILASAIVTSSDVRAEPRAVIELFTSQGCSSCPAADKLVGELARDPSLIVMSLPIDYWDYLGWKDTLAIPGHAKRQKAYSKVRGDREVYTPQVVVNGVAHALGSDKTAIENAIAHSRKKDVLALPVSLSVSGDQISVSVPAAKSGVANGEVWLCPITRNAEVTIERGENKGNSVTYHNVVRRWTKLGEYTGAARTFTVPTEDVTNVGGDAVAVVVQSGSREVPSAMLGAAVVALK